MSDRFVICRMRHNRDNGLSFGPVLFCGFGGRIRGERGGGEFVATLAAPFTYGKGRKRVLEQA